MHSDRLSDLFGEVLKFSDFFNGLIKPGKKMEYVLHTDISYSIKILQVF